MIFHDTWHILWLKIKVGSLTMGEGGSDSNHVSTFDLCDFLEPSHIDLLLYQNRMNTCVDLSILLLSSESESYKQWIIDKRRRSVLSSQCWDTVDHASSEIHQDNQDQCWSWSGVSQGDSDICWSWWWSGRSQGGDNDQSWWVSCVWSNVREHGVMAGCQEDQTFEVEI